MSPKRFWTQRNEFLEKKISIYTQQILFGGYIYDYEMNLFIWRQIFYELLYTLPFKRYRDWHTPSTGNKIIGFLLGELPRGERGHPIVHSQSANSKCALCNVLSVPPRDTV